MSEKVYTVRVTVETLTDGVVDQRQELEEHTRGEENAPVHVLKAFRVSRGVVRGVERAMEECAGVAGFVTTPEDAKAAFGGG